MFWRFEGTDGVAKHDHGRIYRAKITSSDGQVEYSKWFYTEEALRDSMRGVTRNIGKRYYCEAQMVLCHDPACDVDPKPRVIASL
jgi:hypothetical protein